MSERKGFLDCDAQHIPIQKNVYWMSQEDSDSKLWSPQNLTSAGALVLKSPEAATEMTIVVSVDSWLSPSDVSAGGAGTSASHGLGMPANTLASFAIKGGKQCSVKAAGTATGKCSFAFGMLNFEPPYGEVNG